VTLELIVLALATAIRPSSLAAVYALMATPTPRRLITAYVLAGAVFTITIGLIVILGFHGLAIQPSTKPARAAAEIAGGVVALVFAVLLLTGRMGNSSAPDAPKPPSRLSTAISQRTSVRSAALAGPVTHIPGLLYLLALNLIVSQQLRLRGGLFNLLVYNAVWFSVPIVALVACILDPTAASNRFKTAEQWARQHGRSILVIVLFALGVVFLVNGLRAA
jgi:hypothetical protein